MSQVQLKLELDWILWTMYYVLQKIGMISRRWSQLLLRLLAMFVATVSTIIFLFCLLFSPPPLSSFLIEGLRE